MDNGNIVFDSVTAVPKEVETLVLEYENTSGSVQALAELGGEGSSRCEWFIYIDDVLKAKRRITSPNINLKKVFNMLEFQNGTNIKVKVIHYEDSSQEFSSELRYINE